MEDMNNYGSRDLMPLDAMKSSWMLIIWTILSRGPMAPNALNNSWLWMTWTTLGRELKALYAMNSSRQWLTWMTLGHEPRALEILWTAQGYCWHDYRSWSQGSRCYEQLRVRDDMTNSRSNELRHLDAMNNIGLRMIRMIFGRKSMILNAMNNSGLWMTWMTLAREVKALDAMNSSRLWSTWRTLRKCSGL